MLYSNPLEVILKYYFGRRLAIIREVYEVVALIL